MTFSSYTKDKDGRYLSANREFVAFTQLDKIEGLLGKKDHDMPWSSCADPIMTHDAQVMSTGESQIFIEEAIINGKKYLRRCFKSPMLGTDGRIIGVMGMSTAIDTSLLSSQQTTCLTELAMGASLKQIAKKMKLSPRTVEHYLNDVKIKLNCKTRSELVLQALKLGLINY